MKSDLENLNKSFDEYWHNTGSGISPKIGEELCQYSERVARDAFIRGMQKRTEEELQKQMEAEKPEFDFRTKMPVGSVWLGKCPECVSVGFHIHVRFGCLADQKWNQRVSSAYCKPEVASPDYIELGKLAAFGKSVWDWIKENPDFCGDELSETFLPMAEEAGLCRKEPYDPEKHGEIEYGEVGFDIWAWD